jgi:hypothetical protein
MAMVLLVRQKSNNSGQMFSNLYTNLIYHSSFV